MQLLSLFEPSTEVIRKGKAGKPNEFGKMVKLQEAENQIITDYEVYARRPYNSDLAPLECRGLPRATWPPNGRRTCCHSCTPPCISRKLTLLKKLRWLLRDDSRHSRTPTRCSRNHGGREPICTVWLLKSLLLIRPMRKHRRRACFKVKVTSQNRPQLLVSKK